MDFDEIMERYWQGEEGPFIAMVNRDAKMNAFSGYTALSYLLLSAKNTVSNIRYGYMGSWPNLRNLNNVAWTLRWAVKILFWGDRA